LTASWDTIVTAGAYILLSFISMGCLIGLSMISVRLAGYCTGLVGKRVHHHFCLSPLTLLIGVAWLFHLSKVRSHANELIVALTAGFNKLGAPFWILLGLLLVVPLSFLAHKYTRLASLVDYVDEKGRSCLLPRIEAPSRETSPAKERHASCPV
jgi:hypothetical protein